MEKDVEDKVHELLVEFAKENSEVLAVYKGREHEDNIVEYILYYFIKEDKRYDKNFSNKLTNLRERICKGLELNIGIMHLPVSIDTIEENRLVGKCIYKRD